MAQQSLSGLGVLVTRSPHQAGRLVEMLQALNADVFELPVISIAAPDDTSSLDKSLLQLASYDWVLFASVNAVQAVLKRLEHLNVETAALQTTKLAAIGPSTAAALQAAGLVPDFCPSRFIAESLVEEFPGYPRLENQKMLWPRPNVGRDYIAKMFNQAGATVEVVQAYKTEMPENRQELSYKLCSLINSQQIQVITLASSQSAKNLAALLSLAGSPAQLLQSVAIACIGPETSQAAKEFLGRADVQPRDFTIEGLVDALCQWNSNRPAASSQH